MHVRTRHRDKYKGIKIYLKGINNATLALIRHKAEKATKPKKSRSQKSHEAKKAKKPKKSRGQKSHKAKNATKPKMQHLFFTEYLVGIVKLLIFLYIHDVATI